MTQPAFDILCPMCRSVVPHDAPGCPTCAAGRNQEPVAAASIPAPKAPPAPDINGMALKDYHRLVRSNHRTVESPRLAGQPGGGALVLRTYAPFVLLALGLIVVAVLALGRL